MMDVDDLRALDDNRYIDDCYEEDCEDEEDDYTYDDYCYDYRKAERDEKAIC